MSPSEYVANFIAIVVGLALADIAHSLHRLLRARRKVRWNILTPLAALLVTATVVNAWWIAGQVFAHALTFAAFLPNLASLILLFLLASAALPDAVPDHGLDLNAYYMDNRTYFWGLFALYLTALVINEALSWHAQGRAPTAILADVWPNLAFLPIFGLLMWTKRRLVHIGVVVFALVVVVGSWGPRRPGLITEPPAAAAKV